MSETAILQRVRLRLSQCGVTIWRNNVAMAWVGKVFRPAKRVTVEVGPDDVVLRNARPLHAGLCEGSSDLIGLRVVTITEAMIGQRIAQFVAVEVKSETGRATQEQTDFLAHVLSCGGIAAIVRSADEARAAITSHSPDSARCRNLHA